MAMTPFALAVLGAESINRREQGDEPEPAPPAAPPATTTTAQSPRRAASYYNQFQTVCTPANDDPPAYGLAAKHSPSSQRTQRNDILPKYSCTVAAEGKFLLNLESMNPLHLVSDCEWREVYVVLRGTLLSFHRPKDNGPGRLLRNYTLQHAEIGLATDTQHTVLVPQTRLAHFIPSGARAKAWKRDPGLFRASRQHILRLRAETDQILLAHASEDDVHTFIHAISAAIDISHAIDERSIPRQCTVPRRRRRPRSTNASDINDPALLAEQARILRDMYPDFAGPTVRSPSGAEPQVPSTVDEIVSEAPTTPTREEDELDLAMIREDNAASTTPSSPAQSTSQDDSSQASNPSDLAPTSATNLAFSTGMMYATSPTNFCPISEKWQPPHHRTQQQIARYIRRCMPILPSDAVRASDVLIRNGRRVKINWRMELLEEWELKPPSYKSHGFENDTSAERAGSISQSSTAGSAAPDLAPASTSLLVNDSDDQITPMEEVSLEALGFGLTKSVTADKPSAPTTHTSTMKPVATNGFAEGADVHGMVFCF